ncbi:MAG: class I SAM-dependent methyltransferase [Nanoarchaeota archaeon]|nr:class I SAM-dependent methyltransferase [Nanoarchaeota archaeon]
MCVRVETEYWNEYQGAKTYATLMPLLKHYTDLQERVLALIGSDCIIGDFACGPGLFSMRCLGEGKRVFAVDKSKAMLDHFKDNVSWRGIFPTQLAIAQGDLKNIPLDDESVETAVCMNALYNNDDPRKIVLELVRVAKNQIIITGPKPSYDHDVLLESSKKDFRESELFYSHKDMISEFLEGNEKLKKYHMPALIEPDEVVSLLLENGCSSAEIKEDIYLGQGYLVVGLK